LDPEQGPGDDQREAEGEEKSGDDSAAHVK
jgi:hypothetical protein